MLRRSTGEDRWAITEIGPGAGTETILNNTADEPCEFVAVALVVL